MSSKKQKIYDKINYMNLEYYINKLNKDMPKLPKVKQDRITAEIIDIAFSDQPVKKRQSALQRVFKKYFK